MDARPGPPPLVAATARRYGRLMPVYEYRCRSCGETLERLRPVAEADDPVTCRQGHDDTVRLLSMIAARTTVSGTSGDAPAGAGGCCGGGCCG